MSMGSPTTPLEWSRLFRGLYGRVAKRVGVDASYVSRVARGERHSEKIERALNTELARIEKRRPA
jgi:transcriptional regulator with XRE-family HTH domain